MRKLLAFLFVLMVAGTFSGVASAQTSFIDRFTGSVQASIGKAPVLAATTGSITLAGNQLIDGIMVSDHVGTQQQPDRVLVKNQTDTTTNGIYTVSSTGAWSRAKDFTGTSGVVNGQLIYVSQGSTNFGFWTLTSADPITVGLTGGLGSPSNITFTQTLLPSGNSIFAPGALKLAGSTSGNTILNAAAIASGTITVPAATDQLVAQNTADTLTNKTIDTANNVLKFNGTQVTALNGSTANLATVSGTLTNGHCVSIDSNHNIIDAGGPCTTGGGGGTVSSATANQLAYYASNGTVVTGNANITIGTAALTLGQSGSVAGTLILASSGAAGKTTLAQNSGTSSFLVTLPAANDTLVGKATTDTLTNKTFDTAGTGNVFKINGTTISSNTGTGANVLAASPTLSGTITGGTFAGTHTGSGSGLTGIGTAALGGFTGTPSSTTYARGDGTWATISAAGNYHSTLVTSSGTWTSPSGISGSTLFKITLVGGGGGGGTNSGGLNGGGGGGGGSCLWNVSGLSASTGYSITIGGAGGGGSAPFNGGQGGTTSMTIGATTVSAGGGNGGTTGSAGGASGSCTNATTYLMSTVGTSPITSAGGFGGSSALGAGAGSNAASASQGFGGGGAGGNSFGGDGAAGAVLIEWVQ